ncbi:MAG: FAD-dependent oxidoreductase, partial [Verrucomicrobiota bacterium]|nr:FAD-dependent oxidoreductase [Verrucomicrobiota bacterium]
YCAQALSRALKGDSTGRVALVAQQNFMVFQPMLAEVCGSSISPRHVVNPIRRLCRDVTVLRGNITAIDLPGRHLTLDAGAFTRNVPVEFSHLMLSVGSIVDLSRVPGMPEHAFLMKSVGDALELRSTVIDRLEEASLQSNEEDARKLLTFVVVGGGYSGVETAGQIHDLIQGVNKFYRRIAQPDFRVILVHSGPFLLPEIGESLGRYAEQNMRKRGVEVLLNSRVSTMTASRVHLQDGRVIESHTVVSTVGNAPHPLVTDLCKKNNLECFKGRLMTDATMRVKGTENLWAAGDCAAVPMMEKKGAPKPAEGEPMLCPPTAQFAYRQGLLLGKNIARALSSPPEPLVPFAFTGLGELASIGHRSAVASIFGLQFSGFIAWFMWRTIYLLKLPGLERKLRVMIDWTLDLFFPRDITLLRSKPTEILQEMHLEKGDYVFHSGEPALSFYIVKSGRIDLLDANGLVKSLAAGEHFGERALLHDKIWRFNAIAAEPTTLVALDDRSFLAISSASKSIASFFERSSSQYLTRQQIETLVAAMPPHARELRVDQVMSDKPVTMRPEMTVGDALQLMTTHPYNSFPLVDGEQKVLGVIAQSDVYNALQRGTVTQQSLLSDCVAPMYPSILPETSGVEAMERFCRSGRHKLLVVDHENRLRGILTPIDLFADHQK